jgi:hypothetical protein
VTCKKPCTSITRNWYSMVNMHITAAKLEDGMEGCALIEYTNFQMSSMCHGKIKKLVNWFTPVSLCRFHWPWYSVNADINLLLSRPLHYWHHILPWYSVHTDINLLLSRPLHYWHHILPWYSVNTDINLLLSRLLHYWHHILPWYSVNARINLSAREDYIEYKPVAKQTITLLTSHTALIFS